MGAGCSTGGAAKVQDSIKPSNITELTQEAQEQLKQLQAQNPDGTVSKYKGLLSAMVFGTLNST